MSFVERELRFTFRLGTGDFGNGKPNTVTVTGLRSTIAITRLALPGFDTAQIKVWGMTFDTMNQLSRLGKPLIFARNNVVTVEGNDKGKTPTLIFQGVIQIAFVDFSQPEAALNITAYTGVLASLRAEPASSYPGSVDVANVIASLARAGNMQFENYGVSAFLTDSHFYGTITQQITRAAQDADIMCQIDNDRVVAIWPKNGSRGGEIPLVSPSTGLDGYPSFSDTGISFRCIYNPNILMATVVKLESSIKQVTGKWVINSITANLSCQVVGGPWHLELGAFRLGDPVTIAR